MPNETTPARPDDVVSDYKLDDVIKAMRLDGSLIREKARALTEDGLAELYRRMQDGELTTSTFLDVMKYLAEIGDLKPKNQTTQQTNGPGFSITINIPQETGPPITLEATANQDQEGVMGEMPLKDIPARQLGLTFDNSDLIGDGECT